jgi:gliding motility-associated-like protein
MKKLLLFLFCLVLFTSEGFTQCVNADFSSGSFLNWSGSTGDLGSAGDYTNIVAGFVTGTPNSLPSTTGQHTIMNAPGTDPNTGGGLSVIPPGGTSSCRLGNDLCYGCATEPSAARMEYSLAVTASNCIFTYQYAVVLQDPSGSHSTTECPKFQIYVLNAAGNVIDPVCGVYEVTAGDGSSGYITNTPLSSICSTDANIIWKNWTTVGIDLSTYIGTTVRIQFTSFDCSLGGHFGYAYISCSCGSLQLSQQCSGTSSIMTAPAGFASYSWSPGGFTTQTATYTIPPYTNGTPVTCTCTTLQGCTVTLNGTISVTPPVFNVVSPPAICAGQSATITVTGTDTYTWSNPPGGTGNSITVSPGTTTTYTVTATTAGGCSATSTGTVNVNALPVANAGNDVTICPSASATLDASGSTGTGLTYNWSGGLGTSPTVNVSPASTTTYTVTVTSNGCTASDAVTVTVANSLTVTATPATSTICSGGNVTLTGGGATNYTWSPAGGLNTTSGASVIASPTATTTYTVTGSSGGCTGTASATVTVNSVTISVSPINPTICSGGNVTLTATGTGLTSYMWSPAGGLNTTTGASVIASPTATTTYTVTGSDAGGCSATAVTTVNVITNPVATAGSNSPICEGTALNLTVTPAGGTNYNWSGPNGFSSTLQNPTINGATPAASGTYSVTVTIGGGCTATTTTTVTVNANPVPTAGSNSPICEGTSLNLTSSPAGAAGYNWSGPNGYSNTVQNPTIAGALPNASGMYTVTVTATGGCTATASINVTVNANPVPSAGSNSPICEGSSLNLTSSPAGAVSYNWSGPNGYTNASQNPTIAGALPTATGTYTVTVTATGGCTATASTTVTVNANPVPTAGSNSPICEGTPLNLTSTPAGAIGYNWNGPNGFSSTSQNPTITGALPAASGTYTVTVTATGGCTATASTIVTVNSNPTPTAGSNSPICEGTSLNLTASPGGATSYIWSGPNGFSSAIQNPILTAVVPAAAGTYTVTVTSTSGCTATATTNVVVNVSPTLATTETDEHCNSGDGTATVTASGGSSGNYLYSWSSFPPQQTATAINLSANTYTVTVSDLGCTSSASVTVNNLAGPTAMITNFVNETCSYGNGSATVTASGGNPGYTYWWSNGQTAQTAVNLPANTYTVTVYDMYSCAVTTSVNITNSPPPVATISNIVPENCGFSNGSLTVSVNGGTPNYQYNWSTNPGQYTQTASGLPTGTYYVTVTDLNACTSTTSATVPQVAGPSATTITTPEFCYQSNGTAAVSVTGGTGNYTYIWSCAPTQTTTTATGLPTGSYTVTVDDGGCSTVATAFVNFIDGPNAGFTAHPKVLTIMDGPVSFLDNSAGNIVLWDWNLGDGSVNSIPAFDYDYNGMGTYVVTLIVTDNNGCVDTAVDTIKVKDIFTFYIPSAFTPNNDGYNDFFFPKGVNVDPNEFEMNIFDRWGNMVFHTNEWLEDHSASWNGTEDNSGNYNDVVMDVYVYRIKVKEIDGPKHEYIGRVALIP